jgi:hypothetical protein
MPTPFRKINVPDQNLMRVQDAVAESLSSILRVPILNSNRVDASLTTTLTEVAHGLGRDVQGWIIVRKDNGSDVWEPSESITPKKTVRLQAAAPVNVSILFF